MPLATVSFLFIYVFLFFINTGKETVSLDCLTSALFVSAAHVGLVIRQIFVNNLLSLR